MPSAPIAVDTVADIQNLTAANGYASPPPALLLRSFYAPVSNGGYPSTELGGGLLVFENASYPPAGAQSNYAPGLYFPGPGGSGRYRRVYDGKLSTDDFGIINDGATNQGSQMQNFINALISEQCAGEISSGVGIACGGATIYVNSTGTRQGNAVNGFVLRGESYRQSQLVNCVLSIGQVFAGAGVVPSQPSEKGDLRGIRVLGSIHFWTIEFAWSVTDVRVLPYPNLDPAYASEYPNVDFRYGLIIYQCNHPQFVRVRIEASANGKAAIITGSTNVAFIGGGVASCLSGYYCGPLGLPNDGGGNYDLKFEGLHFEGVTQECINLNGSIATKIIGNHVRAGSVASGGTYYPLIRVGSTASGGYTASSVYIAGNYFISRDYNNTFVQVDNSRGVVIDGQNSFNISSGPSGATTTAPFVLAGPKAAGVEVTEQNAFNSDVASPVFYSRDPAVTRLLPQVGEAAPGNLGSGGTVTWDMSKNDLMYLVLTAYGRTINDPVAGSYVEGETFKLTITKSVSAAAIAQWGTTGSYGIYKFAGSPPTLGSMTTTQVCEVTLDCRRINGNLYFLCDYQILG